MKKLTALRLIFSLLLLVSGANTALAAVTVGSTSLTSDAALSIGAAATSNITIGTTATTGTITIGSATSQNVSIVDDSWSVTSAGAATFNTILNSGVIAAGTWNGSLIGVTYGGTGAATPLAARTNLGAASSGANSDITSLTGLTTPLTVAQGGTGSNSASGARTNLGFGTLATQDASNVNITGGTLSGVTITGGSISGLSVGVPSGGTGASSFTAYAPIFGGTTTTGALQSGTVGTTGQVLTSNGPGALPTFQNVAGTGDMLLNGVQTVTGAKTFNSDKLILAGSTSGTTVLNAAAVAGTGTVTLPTSGTLVNDQVATLSNLSSVGTITTGTWSADTISVARGGTGQTSYTDGQLLIGNSTGNTLTKATLTAGTGISITNGAGSITITNTASGAPTDATYITQTANSTLTNEQALGSLATGILKNTTTTGVLSIASAGTDYFPGRTITGTANQINVSNGDGISGNPTLSLPQNIHTAATPTFGGLTLGGSLLLNGATSGTLTLAVPATVTSHTLTLPDAQGGVGTFLRNDGSGNLSWTTPSGSGDASTNTATSVDSELALFSGTGGKTLKRATGSGVAIVTSGVLSTKTNPAGAFVGDSDSQILSNKTLTTPTIGDFTNAAHDHTNAAGGGTLSITGATTGTLTVARGGTGATDAATARTNLGVPTVYQNQTIKTTAKIWTGLVTGTPSSGVLSVNPTDDNTAGGNAIFTNIYSVQATAANNTGTIGSVPIASVKTISVDRKQVDINVVRSSNVNVLGGEGLEFATGTATVYVTIIGD